MIKMLQDTRSQNILNALNRTQAVIEFDLDGTIQNANQNFLQTMGYSLEEIKGQHHSMFAEAEYASSPEYRAFWTKLNRGEPDSAEYKRIGKGGREVWIQASYIPVTNLAGQLSGVIKFATDVTNQKLMNAYFKGQVEAISKSQAVIEFDLDGTIRHANENFLHTVGYSFEEINGRHHSMFADEDYARSREYQHFWEKLRQGVYDSAEYKRIGKGGKEIWIQASYNPILDMNGQPFKVVKFATDVTNQKLVNAYYQGQIEAISKSQAVIEFDLDGTIVEANQNFLKTMGYDLAEIKGKHHSLFADSKYANSEDYKQFWNRLRGGNYDTGEYKRFGKGGREVWIQASYNPIMNMDGKPFKVVKFATDITMQMSGRVEAKDRSTETRANALTIASATEEMLTAAQEISRSVTRSQEVVNDVIEKNRHAAELTAKLQENAKAMEGIVGMIRDISGQVNLLSLNATIEAARAGDAGKGFAVVANEVKSLATETAKATDQISTEIMRIQEIADAVAQSGVSVSEATAAIGENITIIVAAIEEQTASTHEISTNMRHITDGINSLDGCIQRISGGIEEKPSERSLERVAA